MPKTSLKDCLLEYVDNIRALQQKIQGIRERQQAVLGELLVIRRQCQALREQLSRQGA